MIKKWSEVRRRRPDLEAPLAVWEYAFALERRVDPLKAERDYYRRRWIIHGIRWRGLAWPANALDCLTRAQNDDA